MHHVAVGENETVGSKQEARAGAFGLPTATLLLHLDVYDRGTNALHRPHHRTRVRIEQTAIRIGS